MAKQQYFRWLVLEVETGFMDGPFGSKASADLSKRAWNLARPACTHIAVEAQGVRRIQIPEYLSLMNIASEVC